MYKNFGYRRINFRTAINKLRKTIPIQVYSLILVSFLLFPLLSQDLDWAVSAGGSSLDEGRDIVSDDSGNLYVTGRFIGPTTFSPGTGDAVTIAGVGLIDIFIAKYSSSGQLLWVTSAGGTLSESSFGIALDPGGDIWITGRFDGATTFGAGEVAETTLISAGGSDLFVARYANNGNLIWAKRAGGSGANIGESIKVDNSGNAYITGRFDGTTTFGPGEMNETMMTSSGGSDIVTAKFDPNGLLIWAKQAGSSSSDGGEGNAIDAAGNSYVTGSFRGMITFGAGEVNQTMLSNSGGEDFFLAKYNSAGEFQWVEKASGGGSDGGKRIAADASGNTFTTGLFPGTVTFGSGQINETTLASAGGLDVFLVKYDPTGELLWARSDGGSGTEVGRGVDIDAAGNSYVTGEFSSTVAFGAGESNETTLVSSGGIDIFMARYAPGGQLDWIRKAGGNSADRGFGITVDAGGNVATTGTFQTSATFGDGEPNETVLLSSGDSDIFVARIEAPNQPPTALCQNITISADNNCQALVTPEQVDNGSSDPDGDPITLSLDPPGPYGLGNTTVTLTVSDGQASDQCQAIITVIDDTAPTIACPADITTAVDPGTCAATVYFTVSASDFCDSNVDITCTPTSGSIFPLGETTVNCTATDDAGNTANCSFLVTVTGGTGIVSGTVSVAGNGLQGVTVKLLESAPPTTIVDEQSSDAGGGYSFAEIPTGNYTVMVVEPLGYISNQNDVDISLNCGETVTVDFNFSETIIANQARSKGYWKHQFDVYVKNKGNAQESAAALQGYLDEVNNRYNPHFNLFADATDGSNDFQDWQAILSVKGNAGMNAKARAQLASLLLNIMSQKLAQYEVVTADDKTAGDVMTYTSQLIEDSDPANDELAKDLSEAVNHQQMIAAGLVPSGGLLYKAGQDLNNSSDALPQNFRLYQNYPNPFNPTTTIRFDLPEDVEVYLQIYSLNGRKIRGLHHDFMVAGKHSLSWDATNDFGQPVASGIYIYRLTAGSFVGSSKMLLLK